MQATPARLARSRTMRPLSLIDGPMMASTPASTRMANERSTSAAVPMGRPLASSRMNSTGRSRRPPAVASSSPSRAAASMLPPSSYCGKSKSRPINIGEAVGASMAGHGNGPPSTLTPVSGNVLAGAVIVSHELRERAARFGDRVALRVFDGPTLTFAEGGAWADALARGLVEAGVVMGDRVALLFANADAADFWV